MDIDRSALEAFVFELVRTPSPSGEEGAVAVLVRADLGVNAVEAVGAEPGLWVFCTNGSGTAALTV